MKVEVEICEREYGLLCRPEEVEPLMRTLSELYGLIWAEAKYDPCNEQTKEFASRLLSLIRAANKILRFKE